MGNHVHVVHYASHCYSYRHLGLAMACIKAENALAAFMHDSVTGHKTKEITCI